MTRLAFALLIATALLVPLIDGSSNVSAAPSAKKTQRRSQPASQAHAAPDVTATIPQTAKKDPPAPAPTAKDSLAKNPVATEKDDESIPPPFNLPTASRARMRLCGERWQAMKMSGSTGDETWRAYATKCLASTNTPGDDSDKNARR